MTRRRVSRSERTEPTPETRAKKRPDLIAAMYTMRLVDEDQRNAAEEIRSIMEIIYAFPGAVAHGDARVEGNGYIPSLDTLNGSQRALYARYAPWADGMRRFHCLEWNCSALEVMRLVLIEDVAFPQPEMVARWLDLYNGAKR